MPEQSINGDLPIIKGQPYTYYFFLPTAEAGGSGGNPTGGEIDISVINYKTALMQQWISLTIGSPSAQLLNLLNAELETFNIPGSTFLYSAYTPLNFAADNNNYWQLQSASGARLPGLLTPANLKMSLHFQGTNDATYANANDVPVYTASTGNQLRPNTILPSYQNAALTSAFFGKTYSSNAGVAANAFDGDVTTSCSVGSPAQNTMFVTCDLGSAQVLTHFAVKLTNTNSGITAIQGSNDNSAWTTILSLGNGNKDAIFATSNAVAYRYYRLGNPTSGISNGEIFEFTGFTALSFLNATYTTSSFAIGNSSLNFNKNVFLQHSNIGQNLANLYNHDWQIKAFVNLADTTSTKTIVSLVNELELQVTTSGLRLRYATSTNPTFVNIDSDAINWQTNQWYYISVRRTGNTLYFYVDGVLVSSASFNVTMASSSVMNIGADSLTNNAFYGNMQELELFVKTTETDSAPASPRSTAFLPPVDITAKANYIPSNVEKLSVLLFLDEVTQVTFGIPVVNTDLTLQVSIDNGSTWNTLTLTKASALSTLTNIYSAELNLIGLTNTNQFKYRITNNAGKVMKFDGLIAYWN